MKNKDNNYFTHLSDEEYENSTVFSKPEIVHEKTRAKKGMKIYLKATIAVVLALLIIAGSILLNLFFGEKDSSSTASGVTSSEVSSEDTATFNVLTYDTNAISSATIENEHGKFTFVPKGTGDNTLWYVKGIDKALQSTDSVSTTVEHLASVDALLERDYEEGFDYGFSDPSVKANVTLGFGEYSFIIGKKWTNGEMTGAYLKTSLNDKKVYIIPGENLELYNDDLKYYLSLSVPTAIEKTDDNEDYFGSDSLEKFDYIKLSGSVIGENSIKFEMYNRKNSTILYKMTEPQNMLVNSTKIYDLMSFLKSDLESSEVLHFEKEGISSAALKKYKLDKPFATIEYKVGKTEHTITLSQHQSGIKYYALQIDNSPIIYKVPHTDFEFLRNKPYEYASTSVLSEDISTLKKLEVVLGDKSYKIDLSSTTEDDETVVTAKYNGKELEFDNVSNFYAHINLIGPYVSEKSILSEAPKGTQEYFTLKLHSKKDDALTLSVYKLKSNSQRYYIELDGKPVGLCEKRFVDFVYNNIENLCSDKAIAEI